MTWDMAHHLYARFSYGRVLVVAERPLAVLAALRKQWLKVVLKLRKEYSRTTSPARKAEISHVIVRMQTVPFAVALPLPLMPGEPPRGIYFITPAQIPELTTQHRTIYAVRLPALREPLKEHLIVHGLLVEYD